MKNINPFPIGGRCYYNGNASNKGRAYLSLPRRGMTATVVKSVNCNGRVTVRFDGLRKLYSIHNEDLSVQETKFYTIIHPIRPI